jgi:cytochrome P450
LAGSETTATAIRATLLYIITNPPVYNTLLAEISSNPISNPITDSEARTLVYLQAIIREGLRMFPPAPILGFRQVPKGGDTVSGYFVPENTKIGYNMFGLTRDPKLWGEDAKIFRPERWLNKTLEETVELEANVGLVFGYGKWQCLGRNLAQMQLNKILVQVCDSCARIGGIRLT